jgi:hypothetical protein
MATVGLLPDAEDELEALPLTEEVALRTVMAKLEALGAGYLFLTRAPFVVRRSENCARGRVAALGGRFTGARERRTSSSGRSAQRPLPTRGDSSGQCG